MRRLLLSAIASLLVFAASAQTVFKGNVKVADKGTAIGYATVAAVRDSLVGVSTVPVDSLSSSIIGRLTRRE